MYILYLRATMQQNLSRKYGTRAAQGIRRTFDKRAHCLEATFRATMSLASSCLGCRAVGEIESQSRDAVYYFVIRIDGFPIHRVDTGATIIRERTIRFAMLDCSRRRVLFPAPLYNVVYFVHSESVPPQITKIRIYEPPPICKSCTFFFTPAGRNVFRIRPTKNRRVL